MAEEATVQHAKFHDPLLACLRIICRDKRVSFSEESAVAGLPLVRGRLTPLLFARAAEQVGLHAKLVERPLAKISNLILPCVLILKDNQACVLHQLDAKEAQVTFTSNADQLPTEIIALTDLGELYSGIAILIQIEQKFDKHIENYHIPQPRSWFWGTLWHFRSTYMQAIIAAFLSNVFLLCVPLFAMNVYDRVIPNTAYETLWVLATGVIFILLFDFVARTLRGYLLDAAGQKVDILIASRLFQHVLGMHLKNRPASVGAFASQIKEFDVLRDFFTSATLVSLVDLPFAFLFLLVIAMIGGPIVWIPFLSIPIVVGAAYFLEIPMRQAVERANMGAMQKHSILLESLAGIETLKAQSAEGAMQTRWERFVQMASTAGLRSRFFSSMTVNITIYIQQMVTILLIIYGVYLIGEGDLSMGGLIACSILGGRALAPLGQVTNLLVRFEQTRVALEKLDQIMHMPLERSEDHTYLSRPVLKGDVEFEKVSFSYVNQPLRALDNLSFSIKAGEKIGVIGRVGSGKTTLTRLVIGFYTPDEGAVRIDGTDLAQIDPVDLRNNVGYVSQETMLFYGTVRDNIVLGNVKIEDEDVLRAAKISGVEHFVSRHPYGYDLPVGERGEALSGGQRQAIALARMIVRNPNIIILDEPTASMDTRSEKELLQRLKVYLADKTLILATHRASMLELVDRLIVLDNGRLVADGKKEDVLARLAPKPQTSVGNS